VDQLKRSTDGSWNGYKGWLKSEDLSPATSPSPFLFNAAIQVPVSTIHDPAGEPLLELLFGSRLLVSEYSRKRCYLLLPDNRQAWVKSEDVVMLPRPVSERWRSDLLSLGRLFVDTPYFWGGRSSHVPQKFLRTGVDCSALVNLLYGIMGITLPRDAADQFAYSENSDSSHVSPADLVFLAPKPDPIAIDHVMLFGGGEHLLEASLTAQKVQWITFEEKLGVSFSEIKQGKTLAAHHVFYSKVP
jgi:hypothetical protein